MLPSNPFDLIHPKIFSYFRLLKKISTIFLLSIYLLSATNLYELLKVKILIEHYEETMISDGPISFLDFLAMHYITDDGNNKDDDRDSQLPFKSHGSVVASNSPTVILNRFEEISLTPVGVDKKDFHNYDDPFIVSDFCDRVWNPPKLLIA